MPRLDPAAARAAKQKLAERLLAIALGYVPPGWTVAYRKSLSGGCYLKEKRISAPRPVTRKSLYIFLHECAHAHLHVVGRSKRHVEELEAEQWAHARMREHGIAVPRTMTKRAKAYVGRKIDQAKARGAKRINREAEKFARRDGRQAR
jgi:hypothetical protein